MLSCKMMTLWRRRLMTSHIKMRSAYWQQRPACYRISEDYLNALLHSNLTLGVLWAKTHRAGGYSSCVRCQASRLLQLTARSSRVSVIPRRSHLARCNYERSDNCTFIISASTAAEGLTGGWGGGTLVGACVDWLWIADASWQRCDVYNDVLYDDLRLSAPQQFQSTADCFVNSPRRVYSTIHTQAYF